MSQNQYRLVCLKTISFNFVYLNNNSNHLTQMWCLIYFLFVYVIVNKGMWLIIHLINVFNYHLNHHFLIVVSSIWFNGFLPIETVMVSTISKNENKGMFFLWNDSTNLLTSLKSIGDKWYIFQHLYCFELFCLCNCYIW